MNRARPFALYARGPLNLLTQQLARLDHEVLLMISLDAQGCYVSDEILFAGDADRVEGRYRVLVQRAFYTRAAQLVVAHNHPSGAAAPSAQDISFTRHLRALGQALEIELVDHLIVSACGVFSMKLGRVV